MSEQTHLIKVWRFEDAPKEYQALSTNGGDEDWIVFVPTALILRREYINWLDRIDSCNEPSVYKVNGGEVYIGVHS